MSYARASRYASRDGPRLTRERAVAFGVALALEAGLILLIISIAWHEEIEEFATEQIVRFEAVNTESEDEAQGEDSPRFAETAPSPDSQAERADADAEPQTTTEQAPRRPEIEVPSRNQLPFIPLSRDEMARADVDRPKPRQAAPQGAMIGPPDIGGGPRDSPRVSGTAPNGEPLYRAAWHREPTDAELAGYLSTADGPGWALIACRTAPRFRVEDCVLEQEYPAGSRIGRSVLAASWQFRVRPPRIGGQLQTGAWVRIHISYETNRPL